MKAALLGNYADKPRIAAFTQSCLNHGIAVENFLNAKSASPDGIAFAFTSGNHRAESNARKAFARAGVPVVVLDLGYLDRASFEDPSGYHQVGIGGIGWLPPEPQPSDRFEALGIEVEPRAIQNSGVLVLGQVPGDSQHPFGTHNAMQWWLTTQVQGLSRKAGWPNFEEVVYRPHPLANKDRVLLRFNSWWTFQDPEKPIEEAIREASLVVTYNSTAAVEAVRQGVPVVCSTTAHYYAVREARLPERLSYFHRLAYAQWNLDEIARGEPLRFLAPYLGIAL